MCQDENETENKSFRIMSLFVTGLFQNIQERTKALVLFFVFVFVLVDEQAIRGRFPCHSRVSVLQLEKAMGYYVLKYR